MGLTRVQRFLRHGSLPQLAAFESVARLSSFTRAAEALHMAQPTVSQHVRKLSESVGHPLFEQVGRQIRLTEAGRLLYDAAIDIFQTLEHFDARASAIETAVVGNLRLAVSDEAMIRVLPLLERFAAAHPDVCLQLERGSLAHLRRRMSDNEDDLYLLAGLPSELGVVRQRLAPLHLLLVAALDHPLALLHGVGISDLLGHSFLLQPVGSVVRTLVEQALDAAPGELQIRLVMDDEDRLCEAAARGLGLAVLPAETVSDALAEGRLINIPAAGFPMSCECCFAYPVGKRLSAAARAFLAGARDIVVADMTKGQSRQARA